MLEKFLKGTYSFERQLGKNIVFSKDEIAIIHKRKAFWEKLVHIENLINLPYFSQINQSELNMLLGEKGFEAKENDDLKEWEAMDQAIRNKKYGSVDLPKFKWINPTTQKAEDDTPFINFFIPFIKYAKGRLDEQINKCGTRYLVNDNLQKDMVKILIGHLYKLCIRVLILELNVCREENQLQGENATERMEFYSNVILKDEQYWEGLLVEYPVMYRLISKGVNNWINNMCDLLTRFSADQNYLCSIFRDNSRSFSIIKLDGDMSDAHNGGKTVFKLTLSNNKTIVYKPRSLKLDRYFNEVLEWYNSQCVKYPIYQPKIIDRETYGWMEFIENKKCQKESELEEYYYKIGVMLGLLYLLRTTDIHYENIIAFSANPVLIDLEALFHNRFHILEQNTAPGKITGIIEGSVRNVGILPNLTWHSKNHRGVDISALGGDSNQIVPMEMPVIKDYLSDEIRIEYDKGRLHSSNNRPISDDKKINIYNYRLSIEGGFLEAYSTIKESMNTFKQLVEIFKTVKVRQIIRSTQQYSTLLNIGTHPDYLRSGLDREMLFTTLYKEGKFEKKYNLVAPYEIKDLLDNDIPFFVNYPDETKLLHSRGKIEGVYEERGIDLVKGQLENMSEENCEIQLNFIRMSLMDEEKYTVNPVLVRRHDKDEKRLLEIECYKKAKEIGEELARTAISGNSAEDIGWIITNVTGVEETNWSVEPSGIDLYNGTPGILLFMAALYKITREEKYLEITKRGMNGIIKTLEKCLSIKNEMEKETVIGAYTGETSNLFPLIVIGDIIGEDYTELCSKILSNTINVVDKDENFDVVAGAAGCILQTYNVVGRKGLEKKSIELISKCADYLIVKATKKDDMMMWKPQIASNALAGYSHGAAGIALALIKAGEILGKIEYFIAAEKALNYERSLYVEKEKNWADIRALGGVTNYSQGIIPATWCHGAPGILMSRIIMLEYIKEEKAIKKIKKEIEVSLETTIFKGFGKSHCLCHGDLGNIDILLQASNYSDKEKINNVVYSYLDANISKFKLGRYKCGLPGQNNTPSLMIGLAGIGYEFLKIYDSSLPSVLSLSVDK